MVNIGVLGLESLHFEVRMRMDDEIKCIERKKAIFSFLFFFLVIAVFWTLKPLRTSGVVKSIDLDYYPLVKQGVLLFIPFIIMVYSFLACFFTRARLVYFFCAVFVSLNVVFWWAFETTDVTWVKLTFFYYVDAYTTIMVTIFWTYVNDIHDAKSAKRVYGFIGAGGLLGGILGSLISGWASGALGNQIILVSALLILPISVLVRLIEKGLKEQFGEDEGKLAVCRNEEHQKKKMSVFTEGIAAVLKSKYLFNILLIVGIYEVISAIIDYQFNVSASAAFDSVLALSSFQGKVFFSAQVMALGIQLVIVPIIYKRYGVISGLLFLPMMLGIGALTFIISPILPVIGFMIASEASLAYSVNQASKEILYIPLDAVSKYKGKAFIDMFGIRMFKTLGAGFLLFYTLKLKSLGVSSEYLMVFVLVLAAIWLRSVFCVSKGFKVLSRGQNEN